MEETLLKSQAFKLKGRLFTFTVIKLLQADRESFTNQLDEVIKQAPKLFNNTPVVVDVSLLRETSIDLQEFCKILRAHSLLLVGIQGANPQLTTAALSHGIAVLHASSIQDKSFIEDHPEEFRDETVIEDLVKTKLLTTPIRSGQQVVSKGADLVITASVSHGAELLADGNIHVYGTLRGRALAGISGNKQARIFCHALEAELVSIAGYYRLSDAIGPISGPCQIYLQDEHIHIEPLC
jgi:septum site-determining protein MinC